MTKFFFFTNEKINMTTAEVMKEDDIGMTRSQKINETQT